VPTRSKRLWLDGFLKLNSVLTGKELSDLQEVMRDKELNLRTDIYEILLQESWPLLSRIQLIGLILAWYDVIWCKILSKMFMQSKILLKFADFICSSLQSCLYIACKINIIVEVLVNSGGHPWMMYLNVYTLVNNILKWKENGKIRKLFNVVDCMMQQSLTSL
jgi:hypothetical protein